MPDTSIKIDNLEELTPLGDAATSLGVGLSLVNPQLRVVWQNRLMAETFPEVECGNSHCFQSHWGRASRCPDCLPLLAFRSDEQQEGLRVRGRPGETRQIYRVLALPVKSRDGKERWVLETLVHLRSLRATQTGPGLASALGVDASAATAASMVVDVGGRILSWSPGAAVVFGYDRDEILGRAADLLLPPGLEGEQSKIFELLERDEPLVGFETERCTKDGRVIPISLSATKLCDDQGELIACSVLVEDLSEVNGLRLQLDAQEQLLEHLVRDVGRVVLSVDKEGRIGSWNREAESLFGLPAVRAVGRDLEELAGREFAQSVLEPLRRGERLRDQRLQWQDRGGQEIPIDVSAAPLRDAAGGITGIAVIVRDASEALRLERQMLRSEKLAAVGSLSAGLAHEIGTPLNVISAKAEYLMIDRAKDDPTYGELAGIVAETERIGGLVRELLTFARESAPVRGAVEPEAAVDRVVKLLRVPIEKKGIVLECEVPNDLPAIRADADGLHQILVNLLLNATDAVSTGGKLRIRGCVEPDASDSVILEVHDDGPGVPPPMRERIFDPFFTTRSEGTGLGLAVCSRIVQSHGGDVRVTQSPLGGACFSLQLPRFKETSGG